MTKLRWLSLALLITLTLPAAAADSLRESREQFLKAYHALRVDDLATYKHLEPGLRDYPLYPYLEERRLRRTLSRQTDAAIADFIATYADTPLADRLRTSWLLRLGKNGHWRRFERFYVDSSSTRLQCYHLRASRTRPPGAEWLEQARQLWLVGESQPDNCDPVFAVLYKEGHITADMRWERITLAMANNKLSLARYLAGDLSKAEQADFQRWEEAHRRPSRLLRQGVGADTPRHRQILVHALKRLARRNPSQTERRWQGLWDQYAFTPAQRAEVLRAVGLNAAFRGQREAHDWLAAIPRELRDTTVQAWLIRSALLQQDWQKIQAAIEALPDDQSDEAEWQYWLAQALYHLDRRNEALNLFHGLAEQRNYHGFLAADFLDQPYVLADSPIQYRDADLRDLQARFPGLLRAGELYRANLRLAARREWYHTGRQMNARELELAAVLAHRWGWHDRAIISAAQARALDALDVRFPLLYQEQVRQVASQYQLDPAWIYGVMRQESAFMDDARSPAGALGLMQLMPSTGRSTARHLKLPRPSTASLLQAGTNIQIGSGYLKRVLDRFSNNAVLATAAYNAGPHRVDAWLPENGDMPATVWVDTIPFSETRGYVRAVLAFTTVYDARLDGIATPLRERMPPITARP